jgi:hypothetical protein
VVDRLEDVLEADFVDEYRQGMQFFYSSLVELHTNIFILEKVLAFPFESVKISGSSALVVLACNLSVNAPSEEKEQDRRSFVPSYVL